MMHSEKNRKKVMAMLLSAIMVLSVFSGVGLMKLYAAPDDNSTKGVSLREADASTMDTYREMLNLEDNTRYAGRLWSDKTVFAKEQAYNGTADTNDESRKFDGTTLTLNEELDGTGSNKKIDLDEDFMHVYSVLGSSEEIQESVKAPIDMVLLLDMSGSMAQDLQHPTSDEDAATHLQHSRLQSVLDSMNSAIQMLMTSNEENRVAVIGYGGTAVTLLPLDHYTSDNGKFLTAAGLTYYNGSKATSSGAYTVTASAKKKDGSIYTKRARNNYTGNTEDTSSKNDVQWVGFNTNLQAGIYQAFSELYKHATTEDDVTYKYTSAVTKKEKKVARIPVAFVMTDGGSNFALNGPEGGDEWFNLTIPDDLYFYDRDRKYRAESAVVDRGGDAVILDILLTASFMKSKVQNQYTKLLKSAGVLKGDETAKLPIHTINVDVGNISQFQLPRIYATLDPKAYFNSTAGGTEWGGFEADVKTAYSLWDDWKNGSGATKTFTDSENNTVNARFNKLTGDEESKYGVTNEDIENNIFYNDSFSDITAGDLTGKLTSLIDELDEPTFSPISGSNDLGVDDSVTYMDPIGQYMEIKDVKNVLLFGELHDVTKTAVYSWQFNDDYVNNHGLTGEKFPEGWYRGDSGKDAEKANGKLPDGCGNADEAWEAGWEYHLNTDTAVQFVPSLSGTINVADPDSKIKLTEYTFYRLSMNDDERKALHMNPAYLEDGQTEDEALAGKEYSEDGAHLNDPGVYALSDMRIWVEDTSDYNDTLVSEPGIESDSNFDQALWVNLPVNMLPLRKVTITQDSGSGNWKYKSNLEHGTPAHTASFPMRVFYTVGMSGEALENGRINVAGALSAQYIAQNKITTTAAQNARNLSVGDIEFFSNWYNPENRYSDYATTNTDYSYGDPVVTFSPSDDNMYYIFQKPQPLYSTAYVWMPEDKLEQSDKDNTQYTDFISAHHGLWKRVNLEEDLTGESDARTFDPADFGGRLLYQDLKPVEATDMKTLQENMWNALGDKASDVKDGDIVLLNDHRLKDVTRPRDEELDGGTKDPFSSDGYYYMPIEFWSHSGDNAEQSQYVVARKGSEFGSAYRSSHIENGDMLCWYDKSGNYDTIYPYLSYSKTKDRSRGRDYIGAVLDTDGKYKNVDENGVPTDDMATTDHEEMLEHGDWVVAAKPGGIRVGGLAQAVGEKTRTAGGETYTTYDEYKNERFPDASGDFAVGYYAGNVTRTANNYYVPTLSVNSSLDTERDVIVNTYQGNNGRLVVQDTTLLATKLVEPPEGETFTADEQSEVNNEEFLFQVYVNKYDGPMDAVVVHYNNGTWQRQFHYIDLKLDSKLFLQTKNGQMAMVDKDGKLITGSPGSYTYADGTEYTGTVYYVYIGGNLVDAGARGTNFRVYHNPSVDTTESVSSADVTTKNADGEPAKQGEKTTFYANKVYLVSQDDYNEHWGELDPAATPSFNAGDHYGVSLNDFELMTIDPNVSDTTDVYFETPYLADSSYCTKRVEFGKVSADAEAADLTAGDLFDQIIPTGDRSDYFNSANGNTENSEIAKYTAQFTLKHGEGLLFSGIPSNTVYRITEKLTDEQLQKGYSLKEVSHNQQANSVSIFRPGVQMNPVYIHPTTYGEYGAGKYPVDYADRYTEKNLSWSLEGRNKTNNPDYLRYEPFHHTNAVMWEYYVTMAADAQGDNHHQPNDPKVKDGTSPFWYWNGSDSQRIQSSSSGTGYVMHDILDNPSCYPLEEGGADKDMGDGNVRHYMFHEGKLVDQHYKGEGSGYIRNIARYLVSPTAHFGVEGETKTTANQSMETYKQNTDYTGVYSVFGNTGTYEESANFINTINNDKTETQINGSDVTASEDDKNLYPGVQEGDTITYEIKWANSTSDKARVVIVDQLDDGVDFVSATCVDSKGNKYTGKYYKTKDAANAALKAIYGDKKNVTVDSGHVVIVDLPDRASGETGKVILTVKVNKDAIKWWDYDGDGVADAPVAGSASDPDFMVRNRATVRVADNAYTTNTVRNLVGEPEKTETSIHHEGGEYGGTEGDEAVGETEGNYELGEDGKYHAPLVYIGDTITYEVTWHNYENKEATVSIRDPLDKNVEFVSAEFDPADSVDSAGEPLDGAEPKSQELAAKDDKSSTDTSAEEGGTVSGYGTLGMESRPVIAYSADDREVTWNLGRQPSGAGGKVTLTVKVLDTATPVGYVDNTAYVKVNGDPEQQTEIVENPTPHQSKTEVTPGDGVMVELGDPITYEINWHNYKPDTARVVVMDTLDPGVDYVKSDGKYYDKAGSTITVDEEVIDIPAHTVVWDLGPQEANKQGKVSLTVKPNNNAKVEYTYKTDADGLDRGEGEDHEVLDQARVKVGNDAFLKTEIVENPVPEKTEADIDHEDETVDDEHDITLEPKAGADNTLTGPTVFVGDKVTYRIYWKNGHDTKADVYITDKLDPGVKYIESDGTYDSKNHTVGWVLKDKEPGDEGYVTVTVQITDKATPEGIVDNRASVRVGNDPAVNTEIIENPTPKVEKIETKPGEGMQVMPGDEIDYEVTWRNYQEGPADVVITDRLDPGVDFKEASFGGVTLDTEAEAVPEEAYADLEIKLQEGEGDEISLKLGLTPPEGKELAESYSWENTVTKATGEWKEGSDEINLKPGEAVTVKDLPVGTKFVLSGDDGEIASGTIASEGNTTELKLTVAASELSEDEPEPVDEADPEVSEDTPETEYDIEVVKNISSGTETVEVKKIAAPIEGKISAQNEDGTIIIEYDPDTRTITWTLKKRPSLDEGKVSFKVLVNEDAEKFWSYDDPEAGPDPDRNDDRVRNQAGVRVGTDPMVKTRIIENPTKPQKTETEINGSDVTRDVVWDEDSGRATAPEVNVGDRITYRITWQNNAVDKNGKMAAADIVITDELDPGVDYVTASPKAEYNSKTRTVTWKLGKKEPRERGTVSLTVRVNKNAVRPGQVVNDAVVMVGNNAQRTDKIVNTVGTDGALKVTKTVEGKDGDRNKLFHFTVTLDDDTINGTYGEMEFAGGTAVFTLKHGESMVASGLPPGTGYEVVETEADKDGYTTTVSGDTGKIPEADMAEAGFVNAKGTTTTTTTTTTTDTRKNSNNPQTGDSSGILSWFALLISSLLLIALCTMHVLGGNRRKI